MTKYAFLAFQLLLVSLLQGQSRIALEQPVLLEEDTIQGTLLTGYPLDAEKLDEQPLLIMIPGSGPTDRNGNSAVLGGENNSFLQLADSLLAYGIATYRYDKLGVGASSNNLAEADMRFADNIRMVSAIHQQMKELGFAQIYLLGHSEGALIASLAARELPVKGLISVAGAGRDFRQILEAQLKPQLPEKMLAQTLQKLDSIAAGHEVKRFSAMLASLLRPSVQPYLRDMLNLNPAQALADAEVPVLIIQGGMDLQVTEEDAQLLREAAPGAEYQFYPEMNHVLKVVKDERQNRAAYTDPDFRFPASLPADLARWIKAH